MTTAHMTAPGAPTAASPRRARRAAGAAPEAVGPPRGAAGSTSVDRFTGDERVGHGPASWDGPIAPRQWGRTRSAPAPSRQDRGRGVRLLTSCPDLAEAVEAVCIGAAVPLTVEGGETGVRASSDVVLVDACWEGEAVPPGVVVVALAEHGDAWDVAARRGASAVVVLPQAAAWLAELISRSVDAEVPRALGRVYGVVGATGGVGASTVASWLAGHFAAQGHGTALVDGDPLGAGLDLVLGEEGTDGLRWPELNQFSGAVAADQLWAAMPRVESLRYLSWDRRATHAETVPAATVVAALRGAAAVQVVDLSRADLERQARWCDAVLVLTPRTVRGVLAAELALARCAPVPAATALTGVNVADLEPRVLADATGVPCAATIAFDARVPQHLDDGTVLRCGRTAKHAKTVAALARALEGLS